MVSLTGDAGHADETPRVSVRSEGETVNTLVESDNVAVLVSWDSREAEPEDVDELLEDARRELEHEVTAAFLVRREERRRQEGSA